MLKPAQKKLGYADNESVEFYRIKLSFPIHILTIERDKFNKKTTHYKIEKTSDIVRIGFRYEYLYKVESMKEPSKKKMSVKKVSVKKASVKKVSVKKVSEKCKEWKKTPLRNPTTGRKIKLNGPTYRKLLKECGPI